MRGAPPRRATSLLLLGTLVGGLVFAAGFVTWLEPRVSDRTPHDLRATGVTERGDGYRVRIEFGGPVRPAAVTVRGLDYRDTSAVRSGDSPTTTVTVPEVERAYLLVLRGLVPGGVSEVLCIERRGLPEIGGSGVGIHPTEDPDDCPDLSAYPAG